jgi:antitoxin CptB
MPGKTEPGTAEPGTAEDDAIRRKRLIFRSWHRGMRETDLMLGRFADRHVATMTAKQLDSYEALIGSPDPDIYNWVTGAEPVPAGHDTDVMRLLQKFKYIA